MVLSRLLVLQAVQAALAAQPQPSSLLQQQEVRELNKSALCRNLSDGVLDWLAAGGAPYSAKQVADVACNMAANIFPNGTIIASPSKGVEPVYTFPNGSAYLQNDYYNMWQRDAGLTMRTLLRVAKSAPAVQDQLKTYTKMLVEKVWMQQDSPNKDCAPWNGAMGGYCSMYGEPKFFVNQAVFSGSWGRLQNDGPAINTLVAMELFGLPGVDPALLKAAKEKIVEVLNWVGQTSEGSTIDPWEMLWGQHFFVQSVQYRAMAAAADLADKGVLTGRTGSFAAWAEMLAKLVEVHWKQDAGALTETVARPLWPPVGPKCLSSGMDSATTYPVPVHQPCELDVATMIGSMVSKAPVDSSFAEVVPPYDSRLLATADALIQSMGPTYEVNRLDDEAGLPGVLLGRYPGDEYSGVIMSKGLEDPCVGFNCGNPWFLTTHALAETLYEAASAFAKGELKVDGLNNPFVLRAVDLARPASQRGQAVSLPVGEHAGPELARMLLEAGDGVLLRAKHHATRGMHMSEQIYRGDGKYPGVEPGAQFGVRDLTWSYASLLDALASRSSAYAAIQKAR